MNIYETPRLPARVHPQAAGYDPTHQVAVSSRPPPDQWLTAPFRAKLLEYGGTEKPYQIFLLRIEGRHPIVLPLLDLLSPIKVKKAYLRFWQQVPELPDRETWRQVCNRWLDGIKTKRMPEGYGGLFSNREYLEDAVDMVRQAEKAGGVT